MQKIYCRGQTALALLLACCLVIGTAGANADIDDFDDGIVEDVQVSDFLQPSMHTYAKSCICMALCMCVCVCIC